MIVIITLIAWAYLELMLFMFVADQVGWLTAFVLTVVTGVAGVAVARSQGLRVLLDARRQLDEGQLPVVSLLDGLMIFVAGILLVIPGLICDIAGILLLVPPVRRFARYAIARWWQRRIHQGGVRVYTARSSPHRPSGMHDDDVIEGQVFHGNLEPPTEADDDPPRGDTRPRRDAEGGG